MRKPRVEQLADAVADGDSVDWESAQALLESDDERAVATQLRGLSSLSEEGPNPEGTSDARLPLLGRAAKIVSRVACLLGIAGWIVLPLVAGKNAPLIFLIGIAIFAGTAICLDMTGRDDRRALALAGVYWTSAASFGIYQTFELARVGIQPFALLQGVRAEAFFPLFLWQFARDFPSVTRFGLLDRLSRVGVILAGAVGMILFVANIGSHRLGRSIPLLVLLDRTHERGRWFWLIVFVSAIAALVWVVVRGELAERKERARVRLFVWTIVAALAPVAFLVLLESTLPGLAAFMQTSTGRVLGALLVYPPMFALPICTAYVVLAHDVLDITAVAQRALRYVLARWLIAWGTSVPLVLLAVVVYLHREEPLTQILAAPQTKLLVWLASIGAVLLACRAPLLKMLDRLMLDNVSDPAVALAELGGELRTARTLMELSALVAQAAARTLQTDVDVRVIEGSDVLVCATAHGVPVRGSLIPVLLQGAGGPCLVAPRQRGSYFSLLSPDDRRWIQRDNIMALCPIVPSGGRVRAVIALKARRNALNLSRTDVQFLTAVCAAAALAHSVLEQSGPSRMALEEELGLQCARCGGIEAWRPDPGACGCGGVFQRAALPAIVAGRLRLAVLLGSGGMGVVYRAQDLVLHRHVAVKTLPRLSGEAAERLLDEARAMAALSHPHIAILYGAEQWRGTPLLMVEYLDGGTLADRLRQSPLATDDAFEMATRLGQTLAYMHGSNRSHGDIKPSNIGFNAHGVVKFLDFGLSRVLQTDAEGQSPTGGTLAYLSPEVLNGDAPGPASDVWALSVVLFQTLTGYHPFMTDHDVAACIRAGAIDVGRLQASVSPPMADLLGGLLRTTAAERPLTAAAFLERLDDVRIALKARSYA